LETIGKRNNKRSFNDRFQKRLTTLKECVEDSLKDSKCRYYESLEFSNVFKENYDFAAISLNLRSLPGKWDNFLDFLLDLNQGEFKFIIICMQEVWSIPKYTWI